MLSRTDRCCSPRMARAGAMARRTVMLVDGVDLLTDAEGAPDLTWLPNSGSASIRVLLTASGGRPLAEVQRRGWPATTVPPLDAAERRAMITTYLGRYSKGLDEVHVARLIAAPATGNALYLRTVLDELRQHGDHFTLGAGDRALSRRGDPRGSSRPGARPLRSRLRARSRRARRRLDARPVGGATGLTEPELLDHLGARRGTAVGNLVASRARGRSRFGHELGPVGVCQRTPSPRRRTALRRCRCRPAARPTLRSPPHSVVTSSDHASSRNCRGTSSARATWTRWRATVSDAGFTALAYTRSHSDLRRLWRRLEESGRRVVDGYRSIVDDPASNPELAWEVARLVTDAGYPSESAPLHRFLVELYRRGIGDDDVAARRLPAALVNYGAALHGQGDLHGCRADLCRKRSTSPGRAATLPYSPPGSATWPCAGAIAASCDAALPLFAEEEAICRRLGDTNGLQASLGNRAQVLRQLGDADGALALMAEQEQLCR